MGGSLVRSKVILLSITLLTTEILLSCSAQQQPQPAEPPSSTPASSQEASTTPRPSPVRTSEPQHEQPSVGPSATAATSVPRATPYPITFSEGETSATVSGQLNAVDSHRYQFLGQQGQLVVSVEASQRISLTIALADKLLVRPPEGKSASWKGELPAAGPTTVEIGSEQPTSYTLSVMLSSTSREAFVTLLEPEGGEVWLEGTTQTIAWHSYGIELVSIEVASGGKAWLVAAEVDATLGQYAWEIPVGLITNFGIAESNAMSVRVSSSRDPEVYDQNDDSFTVRCPRIQFSPGATSATVTGSLDAHGESYRYALQAVENQQMGLEVSPQSLEVDVWGAEDGSTWEIPPGERSVFVDALPATQDYFVTITNVSAESGVEYALTVTIE